MSTDTAQKNRKDKAAPDPEHPAKPDSPDDLEKRSWKYVFGKTFREFSSDQCTDIAAALPRLAAERPDQPAIRCPGRRRGDGLAPYDVVLDYRALDTRSDAIAAGLARYGIGRGVRTVVMVRPSPEFFLLMFALFKAGAVPVLLLHGAHGELPCLLPFAQVDLSISVEVESLL